MGEKKSADCSLRYCVRPLPSRCLPRRWRNRPVLWNNDAAHTPVELPILPPTLSGDNYTVSSRAINNLGHILGLSVYQDLSIQTPGASTIVSSSPILWRDAGVFDLQSLLDPISGYGWTITSASAINDLGQIVGFGLHNGQPTPFLMSPLAP